MLRKIMLVQPAVSMFLITLAGFVLFCIQTSCGPSKEEIQTKKAQAKGMRYKIGDVVYLKPDSCSALITGTEVSFDYNGITNWDSAYIVYTVRDCHGLNTTARDRFIYGLKHR